MIEQNGYPYKFDEIRCATCEGNCCIGESGYIWITKDEIINLATYLDLSVDELKNKFLFKVDYKYSIREKIISKDNYACVFFDLTKKQCSVYDARPSQCRTFPFWDYFKNNIEEVVEECPAIVLK